MYQFLPTDFCFSRLLSCHTICRLTRFYITRRARNEDSLVIPSNNEAATRAAFVQPTIATFRPPVDSSSTTNRPVVPPPVWNRVPGARRTHLYFHGARLANAYCIYLLASKANLPCLRTGTRTMLPPPPRHSRASAHRRRRIHRRRRLPPQPSVSPRRTRTA